jgi:Delta6-protoilludene synthase
VDQAADRTHKYIRTVDEYLEIRRDTIGAKPSFAILETGLNLPDEAVRHPIINELSIVAIDMILLGNVSRDAVAHTTKVNNLRRTSHHTT